MTGLVRNPFKREVLEETGYMFNQYSNPRIYDVLVHKKGKTSSHHIMAFCDTVLISRRLVKNPLPHEVLDGK